MVLQLLLNLLQLHLLLHVPALEPQVSHLHLLAGLWAEIFLIYWRPGPPKPPTPYCVSCVCVCV